MEGEPVRGQRWRFWSGLAAGVAGSAAVVEALLGVLMWPAMRDTYREFEQSPGLASLVLSPLWSLSVVIAIAAASVLVARAWSGDRRGALALAAIATVAIGLVAFTIVAAYMPLWELSGNIRAE